MYAEQLPAPVGPLSDRDQLAVVREEELPPALLGAPAAEQELFQVESSGGKRRWTLKKLSPLHKDMCALIAQGVKRGPVAEVCGITPEYVTMLLQQPLVLAHIKELNQYADVQLDASFGRVVEAIHEGLDSGSTKDKLQAARLQLEVTGRIGSKGQATSPDSGMQDRLVGLAGRLVDLLSQQRSQVVEGEFTVVDQGDD